MIIVPFTRKGYLLQLEILAAAWTAGQHGGDTSTLDRTRWFLEAAGSEVRA